MIANDDAAAASALTSQPHGVESSSATDPPRPSIALIGGRFGTQSARASRRFAACDCSAAVPKPEIRRVTFVGTRGASSTAAATRVIGCLAARCLVVVAVASSCGADVDPGAVAVGFGDGARVDGSGLALLRCGRALLRRGDDGCRAGRGPLKLGACRADGAQREQARERRDEQRANDRPGGAATRLAARLLLLSVEARVSDRSLADDGARPAPPRMATRGSSSARRVGWSSARARGN